MQTVTEALSVSEVKGDGVHHSVKGIIYQIKTLWLIKSLFTEKCWMSVPFRLSGSAALKAETVLEATSNPNKHDLKLYQANKN